MNQVPTGLKVALSVLVFILLLLVSVITLFIIPQRANAPMINDTSNEQYQEDVDVDREVAIYSSEEECESETGRNCDFVNCDYIPDGKTFEEVCGVNFKKGWQVAGFAYPETFYWEKFSNQDLGFEISFPPDWRLEQYEDSTYIQIYNYSADKYVGGEPWKDGDLKVAVTRLSDFSEKENMEDGLFTIIQKNSVLISSDLEAVEYISSGGPKSYVVAGNNYHVIITFFGDLESNQEIIPKILSTFSLVK